MAMVDHTFNPMAYPVIKGGNFVGDILLKEQRPCVILRNPAGKSLLCDVRVLARGPMRDHALFETYKLEDLFIAADYGEFRIPCYVCDADFDTHGTPIGDPRYLVELLIGYARDETQT